MTTTTKAKPLVIHETGAALTELPVVQYERGLSDGSRDRRDGRGSADTTERPRAYRDGYNRGWQWAGVRKRSTHHFPASGKMVNSPEGRKE